MIKYDCMQKVNLSNYFNFLLVMTEKEIKARYKNATLGFLWMFLNPLFQMLVIGLIFQNFVKIPVTNYFLFLFPSLLGWNFFSYSLTKATSSLVWERALIQKAKFPREAIPLSIVFANFFHFLVSLSLFLIFLVISGHLTFLRSPSSIFIFLFSLFWLITFSSGLSLFTSSLNVKYRDMNFFIQALVILWFYATPVIYPLELLPQTFLLFFQLNPLTSPLEMLRFALIGTPFPSFSILWVNGIISFIFILLGIWTFHKESRTFSDWL